MKKNERKEERKSLVIEKIRKITVAMDRGEFWIWILLSGLFAAMVLSLAYYLLI